MLLYNKRAVVCGGSDGIGKSCAQLLAKNGASITIIARNEAKIQSVIDELDDAVLVAKCIEHIVDGEETINVEEEPIEDVVEFVEDLPIDTFDKIKKFFENMTPLLFFLSNIFVKMREFLDTLSYYITPHTNSHR